MRRAARERIKKMRGKPRTPIAPPRNGMLVKSLIPVAYDVFNNRMTMINNLKRLLKVVPVHACRYYTLFDHFNLHRLLSKPTRCHGVEQKSILTSMVGSYFSRAVKATSMVFNANA